MLKKIVVPHNVFLWKFFFQDSFKSLKEQHLCETEIFSNIIHIFAIKNKNKKSYGLQIS